MTVALALNVITSIDCRWINHEMAGPTIISLHIGAGRPSRAA